MRDSVKNARPREKNVSYAPDLAHVGSPSWAVEKIRSRHSRFPRRPPLDSGKSMTCREPRRGGRSSRLSVLSILDCLSRTEMLERLDRESRSAHSDRRHRHAEKCSDWRTAELRDLDMWVNGYSRTIEPYRSGRDPMWGELTDRYGLPHATYFRHVANLNQRLV